MEYFVEWLSWQSWDPCHAWKSLSGGTWPIPGKAKTFAQGIPGIVAWNNNGTTYTYPKAIWTFLQKHSSYDIERVAQDVVKGIETTDAKMRFAIGVFNHELLERITMRMDHGIANPASCLGKVLAREGCQTKAG